MNVSGQKDGEDFPSTHWSLVQRAGEGGADNEALVAFLNRYLPALRAYLVRAHRLPAEATDDLLQEFVLEKVIHQQLIAHADQRRGRFRTFLLTVLNNFVIVQWRKQRASHRSPAQPIVPINEATAHVACHTAAADVFDRAWARQVLSEALRRFADECQQHDRTDLWQLFEARVLLPLLDEAAPPPYEQLVKQLGFKSPAQASNSLITARRRFMRQLRLVIGEYAQDEQEIHDEINHLRQILATG